MRIPFVLLGTLALTATLASGRSISDALASETDLSRFADRLKNEALASVITTSYSATAFVPTDAALERWSQANPTLDFTKFVNAHIYSGYLRKQDFPRTLPSSSNFQNLFLNVRDPTVLSKGHSLSPTQSPARASELEYYVSNAKIIREISGLQSTKGHPQNVFVIDEVIEAYERISSSQQPDAYDFITNSPQLDPPLAQRFSTFGSLLSRSPALKTLFKLTGNHTFFVPVDSSSVSRLDEYQIRAHMIPHRVLNSRVFQGNKEYESAMWDSNIQVSINKPVPNFPSDAFNTSTQALSRIESHTIKSNVTEHHLGTTRTGIVKANVPVSNGVIHFIEQPFTTASNSVWDLLESNKDGQLSRFYQLISQDSNVLRTVKSSGYCTVFAPSNAAFEKLEKRNLTGPLRNVTLANLIAELHIVRRQVTMQDIRNGLNQTATMRNDNRQVYLRIAQATESLQVLTVEGEGVNATAIHPDMGATNGRVHIIDKVLGIPYQSVWEKIHDDFDLSITYIVGSHRNDYWNHHLHSANKKFTYFAPSSLAWKKLSIEFPSEYKQLREGLLAQHGEHILERHLKSDDNKALTFEDLKGIATTTKSLRTMRGLLNVYLEKDDIILEWEGRRARIIRPDVNAINGVIHVIDNVLMLQRDMTTSSAHLISINPSTCVLFAISLLATLAFQM